MAPINSFPEKRFQEDNYLMDLGVFDFEEKSKRMRAKSVHEWVALQEIEETCLSG